MNNTKKSKKNEFDEIIFLNNKETNNPYYYRGELMLSVFNSLKWRLLVSGNKDPIVEKIGTYQGFTDILANLIRIHSQKPVLVLSSSYLPSSFDNSSSLRGIIWGNINNFEIVIMPFTYFLKFAEIDTESEVPGHIVVGIYELSKNKIWCYNSDSLSFTPPHLERHFLSVISDIEKKINKKIHDTSPEIIKVTQTNLNMQTGGDCGFHVLLNIEKYLLSNTLIRSDSDCPNLFIEDLDILEERKRFYRMFLDLSRNKYHYITRKEYKTLPQQSFDELKKEIRMIVGIEKEEIEMYSKFLNQLSEKNEEFGKNFIKTYKNKSKEQKDKLTQICTPRLKKWLEYIKKNKYFEKENDISDFWIDENILYVLPKIISISLEEITGTKSEKILVTCFEDDRITLETPFCDDFRIILMPFKVNKHWALGIYERKSNTILYYDSLINSVSEQAKNYFETVLRQTNLNEDIFPQIILVAKDELNPQYDEKNCKLHVLLNIESYLVGIGTGCRFMFTMNLDTKDEQKRFLENVVNFINSPSCYVYLVRTEYMKKKSLTFDEIRDKMMILKLRES